MSGLTPNVGRCTFVAELSQPPVGTVPASSGTVPDSAGEAMWGLTPNVACGSVVAEL